MIRRRFFKMKLVLAVLLLNTASSFGTKPFGGFRGGSHLQATSATSSAVISSENLALLSERGRAALENLIQCDVDGAQQHVYGDWPSPGTDDDGKKRLGEQLADLDKSYPGGLTEYLSKAKLLLKESAQGLNPFDEYEAVVPEGEVLSYNEASFSQAEQAGLEACAGAVFVLVAGGLGERLGYSGIKLSLETNLCTNKSYLQIYITYIQAMQYLSRKKTGNSDIKIPLVIMTSGDTDHLTRQLLQDNDYFGMDKDLVTIVMQDKVAALKDGSAGLALDDDRWTVQTKPHGHGDVHHLLLKHGLIDKWESEGKSHVIFLQDTNALVINSVIPTLGVSVTKGFDMNSICIPRLAGEAAGAITRLEHKTDPTKSLVINVEYNQLDPLLRTQGDGLGDVADPETGYSPFPGNANNLVLALPAYAKTLRGKDQGVVVEFVNPKYKDASRTEFKKPTRLECMMQVHSCCSHLLCVVPSKANTRLCCSQARYPQTLSKRIGRQGQDWLYHV
jgi:UDP-sugar pyrophosphorylase